MLQLELEMWHWLDYFRLLLVRGAAVNARARKRRRDTALHRASRSGEVEILEMLLDVGDAIDAKASDGNSLMHEACEEGNLQSSQAFTG